MDEKTAQIARESLLLSSAPPSVAETLLENARAGAFKQGTMIFAQNDPAKAVFIVAKGWVKLYRTTQSGIETVVGVFTRGHSFGEAVALRGSHYPVCAEAVTDCTLIRLDARLLVSLLNSNPEAAAAMLAVTYAHLHELVAQIEQLKARTAPQRVAEFLLELTQHRVGPCSVDLPYDKNLIAGRLGMKPESLSRAFSRLRDQGVVVRRETAEINDVRKLRSFVEEDRSKAWHQG